MIAHEKPTQRAICSKHGVLGWYIEPALDQYNCYKVFVTETRSERIDDVVGFPPQNVIILIVLYANAAMLSAQDLVEALQNPTPNAHFSTINDTYHTALINLEELFNVIPKEAEKK